MMKRLAIGAFLVIFAFNQAALAADFRFSPRPNKANLIKWRQWGKESFGEAKREDKLILLSVSAVWCHWCHVMDETTYSNTDVIDYINSNLVAVRVDADMRPDIDRLYNQGGWPSTIILTPDGEVVQGETYIPEKNMLGWLSRFVETSTSDKNRIKERIEMFKKYKEAGRETETEPATPGNSDIERITKILKLSYDNKYGGFGASQKFPNPDAIDFLLSGYQKRKDPEMKTMITTTLDNMIRGKIHDSVEGGFFRYSTMHDWSEPHYEKMLELNAALIKNYASAFMVFGEENYKEVVDETINYIKKYLYDDKTGAFYGSQDADEKYYKVEKRSVRKPPYVDRIIYADSNAQMISALVSASAAIGEKGYLKMSERAADFIIENLYSKNDGVYHYYLGGKQLSGLLSDNVLFGLALIDLYNATGQISYITVAMDIAYLLTGRFYDRKDDQFRPTLDTTDAKPVTAGKLWDYTAALSSYRAVIFLSRIYYYNESGNMKEIIDRSSAKLRNSYERFEPSAAVYGAALRWALEEPPMITIIADERRTRRFLLQVNKIFLPQKVIKVLSLKRERDRIKELGYPLEEAVYVCFGKKCSPAFTSPGGLLVDMKRFLESLK